MLKMHGTQPSRLSCFAALAAKTGSMHKEIPLGYTAVIESFAGEIRDVLYEC